MRAYDLAMSEYMSKSNGTGYYTAWDSISTTLNTLEKNGALNLTIDTKNEFKNSLSNLYTIDYDQEKNFFFG